MNRITDPASSPTLAECISLDEAARRIENSTAYSQPYVTIPERPNIRLDFAFRKIRMSLLNGDIQGYSLRDDDSLALVPVSFWNDDGIRRLEIVKVHLIEDKEYLQSKKVFVSEEDARKTFIIEKDFIRAVECLVRPLPLSSMPTGVLFISKADDEGNLTPITYMTIDDALSAFSEQRKAYIQEKSEDNWLHSQEELRQCLEDGRLKSFHRNNNGFVRPLDPAGWSITGPILARILSNTSFSRITRSFNKINNGWNSVIDIQTDTGPEQGIVIVSLKEADNVLKDMMFELSHGEGDHDRLEIDVPDKSASPVIGRPDTHDKELFATLAFKLIYETAGFPKSQAELIRRTLPLYVAARAVEGHREDPPKETWVKRRASLLWKRLDLGRKVDN